MEIKVNFLDKLRLEAKFDPESVLVPRHTLSLIPFP